MKKNFYLAVAFSCAILLARGTFAAAQTAAAGKTEPGEAMSAGTAGTYSPEDARKIIIARVNGAGITLQALTSKLNYYNAQSAYDAEPEDKEALRKKALDRLIFEELALQKAATQALSADSSEVEKRIEDIRLQAGGPEVFKQKLERTGITEEQLRSDIGRNIVLQKIFRQEIDNKVSVSEDRMKEEFRKRKDSFTVPEKAVADEITFFLDPDKEESVRKAEEFLKIFRDENKKDAADLVPDGTFIVRRVELNGKKQAALVGDLKKLKAGEFSKIIRTSDSLRAFQLKKYTPERQYNFEEMRAYLEEVVRGEAVRERTGEWERELKKGAEITIIDAGERGRPEKNDKK